MGLHEKDADDGGGGCGCVLTASETATGPQLKQPPPVFSPLYTEDVSSTKNNYDPTPDLGGMQLSSSTTTTHTSTSSNHSDQDSHPSLDSPKLSSSTSSISSRSLARQNSNSKIIVFHPSIAFPSKARKLEDVRYVTVMYNPVSGNRRGEKVMKQAVAKFQSRGIEVTTIQLQHKNHATEICSGRADFEDIDILCVIGGDGTFHEVVNGLMKHPLARIAPQSLPPLCVIPAGTGNSMVRELQGISSVRVSTDELLCGTTVPIDILKITILSLQTSPPTNVVPPSPHPHSGGCDNALEAERKYLASIVGGKQYVKKEVIYAFNSIHWGLASRVIEKAEKMRWMGHGIRYTAAALMEMLQGTSTHARVVFEDENGVVTEYENDTFCLLIANNIGTAGKGMKMAPKAKINDGLIDLLLIRSHKPWHLMKIFERVYSGTHIDLPYVEYKQVRKFSIFPYKKTGELAVQANPEYAEELVDIDGELKGCTPFECEVIPHAIELII